MRGILREIALKRSLRMQNIGTRQSHERISQSARDTNRTVGLRVCYECASYQRNNRTKEITQSAQDINATIGSKRVLVVYETITPHLN